MKNQKNTQQLPETTYVGQVSEEQITEWKKLHGKIHVIHVVVESPEGEATNEVAVCYVKKSDRNIIAAAMGLLADKKDLQTGELVIQNCWLGGDPRCKMGGGNEDVAVAAAFYAKTTITLLNGYVKNL
jgi:hypothetical protein